jgi:hypothetical protein
LVGSEEEFVGIEQGVGAQMSLGDEPDLPIGIGQDEVALAGFRGVVHAKHFVDELRIETGILDRMRAGDRTGFEWLELDEQPIVDIHNPRISRGCRNDNVQKNPA